MSETRPIKIAIVSDVFPPKCGGSGWSSFYLAQALAERGNSIHVILPREGKRFEVTERNYEGLPVTEFIYRASSIPFFRNFTRNELLYPRFSVWLEEYFKKHRIQVAHGQHYLTIPPVIMACERSGVASLGTIRDYWAVCYWTTLLSRGEVCPNCSPLNRIKCLFRNQGAAGLAVSPVSLYMASNLRLKQRCLARAGAVLAVSNYVAGKLTSFVPPERLQVLPTFVDFEELSKLSKNLMEEGSNSQQYGASPYLLFIGKLEANKGVDLLLELLRVTRPEQVTLVAGDGSMRGQLEAQALQEKLNVKFLGWTKHEEVLRLIAHSEAVLFPSLWPEPLSRVLLESLGLGALVVAMNTGGTPDLIQDGVNGLMASDLPEMVLKLKTILKPENIELRQSLRKAASQTIEAKFSKEVVVTRIETLYRQLISNQKKR